MNDELKKAIDQFVDASRKAKEPPPEDALTLRQKADDFFAANPNAWFVVVGGYMFARND